MTTPLHIGFIPLVDAAALIVAVDKGFAAAEGLDVTLVREVSWSNVRDKLNIGLFDAAHLLAPVAIASSLGLGHVKVPIVAPFNLGINGNAITVSPALHAALMEEIDGNRFDPLATAKALAALVRAAVKGAEFIEQPANLAEAAQLLARPERIGVDPEVIQRSLTGRLKISPEGAVRESGRYLLVGREGAGRPDPVQAAWLYA